MSLWSLPAPASGNSLLHPCPQQRTQQRTRRRQSTRVQQDGRDNAIAIVHPQGHPAQPVQPVQGQSLEAASTHAHTQQAAASADFNSRLQQPEAEHSMELQAEGGTQGSGSSSTVRLAASQPRQRGQAPQSRRGNRSQPFSRSVYRWPRWREIHDRPHFLEQYPCQDGQVYNVNSFLGKLDPHGGKYYVPPRQYAKFLEEYHQALEDGYQLFLTENYHTQPFRFFMELDFDWEVPDAVVEDALPQVIDTIVRTAQEFYQVPTRPFHVISMRTIHKVHLNFPEIITTELLAHICRDRVIAACREAIGSHHADWLDWERVIDFSHGSFRLMGSHKPKHIQRDPPWVYDKAYYKVNYRPNQEGTSAWVPGKIWLQTLMWSSIFPTKSQIRQFEASPAFLDMIYQDLSADQARMEERLRERLLRTQQLSGDGTEGNEQVGDAGTQAELPGVAISSNSSSSGSESSTNPTQDVKLTLKVMPWGEVKAWLRPSRRFEVQPRPKLMPHADKQQRQEALEFAQARCSDSRFEQLLEVAKSTESIRGQLRGVQQRIAPLIREAKQAEAAQQSSMSSPAQPNPQQLATQHSMPSSPPPQQLDPGYVSQTDSGSQHGQSFYTDSDCHPGQSQAQQSGPVTSTDWANDVQSGAIHEDGLHSGSQTSGVHGEPSQTYSHSLLAGQNLSQGLALQHPSLGAQGAEINDTSRSLSSAGRDCVPPIRNALLVAEEKQALLEDLKRQEKTLQRHFAQLQLQMNAALDSLSEELRKV